jgi:hypothetical protein
VRIAAHIRCAIGAIMTGFVVSANPPDQQTAVSSATLIAPI